MVASEPSLPFLQELYAQDTLYIVPEKETNNAVTLPGAQDLVTSLENGPEEWQRPATTLQTQPEHSHAAAHSQPEPAQPEEPIKWLGEAVKGTYLLFDVPEEVFVVLPQHLFLQKVMSAVGLTTKEIQFGKLSPEKVHDVKLIAAQHQAQHIILFGQGMPVANLDKMEFYRMYRSGNSRFVLVDALDAIENSVELKKKLWDVLQKIFLQA